MDVHLYLLLLIAEDFHFESYGHFGDGKFVTEGQSARYLTTIDSELRILKGARLEPTGISSDWLAAVAGVEPTAYVLTSSFANRQLRMYLVDLSSGDSTLLSTVGDKSTLKIDPTLVKVKGRWFVTYASIEGAVNNGEPAIENGLYQVHLLVSDDLISWRDAGVVLKEKSNLEDPRLFYDETSGTLYLLVEVEKLNLGPSNIRLLVSVNEGKTWNNHIVVDDGNDNEPAGLLKQGQDITVFFSSDRLNPGASYDGAQGYKRSFSLKSQTWGMIEQLNLPDRILLVDVAKNSNGNLLFAAIQDYNSNKRLLVGGL